MICNSGREWREQRKVTEEGISHTKPHVKPLVTKEVKHLIEAIKDKQGEATDFRVSFECLIFYKATK